MPKLFIGFPIPPRLTQELKAFQATQNLEADIRWTPEQNLHITLYFMAIVPEDMIANLHGLLYLFSKETSPFELKFEHYTLAPPGKPARMIWARYKKNEIFTQLHHRIHHLFQQIQVNLQLRKSPIPHITLARIKEVQESMSLRPGSDPVYGTIQVKKMVLWESIAEPGGVRYKARHTYNLGE